MVSGPSRERLYDVFSGQSTDVETRVDRALAIGSEQLGLPIGFLTRIEGGTQEIVQAVGDHPSIQPGNACPLEEAYCRRTVEIEGLLAVQDATASPAISETAVRSFGLGAYIGASVTVNDETYGTVCFADQDERTEEFTDAETHLVESLAPMQSGGDGERLFGLPAGREVGGHVAGGGDERHPLCPALLDGLEPLEAGLDVLERVEVGVLAEQATTERPL